MYREQIASMRVDGDISSCKNNTTWCQTRMCVFSRPYLSLSSVKKIYKTSRDTWNQSGAAHKINNLRHADDTMLIAENKLQMVTTNFRRRKKREREKQWSSVETMSVYRPIFINRNILKQRDQFK